MAVPWLALQAVAISAVVACAFEALVWLLFYRNTGYGRDLEQLDRLGKRLDAAVAELAADPNNNSKKKTQQRLERELRAFSLTLQGNKFKIGLLTAASMIGGMWLINKRFRGTPVAKMPFAPPGFFTGLTHMGLPGDDMTDVSAAFFYATTGPWFRANLSKLTGTGPSRTATKYLNTALAVDKKSA
ncbi:hypothetical protein Rsub_05205 [Raphidocelis subcapitata]|uniref:Calcium load-activated calcium channel n=1 Tax=Raphidocelis subcapitata TaxID=307507 RepID=A0A2V0NY83_9CHLO|nr:hypothetical protein Rsub_05205 [Raphidocelis subcapitata]|eukprot:GBF92591.1 hypothetical protein Rsub_05205 [Raphidocelis subcapitata]